MTRPTSRPGSRPSSIRTDSYWFRSICEQNSLSVRNHQLSLIQLYAELLVQWNKKVNLISRRDESQLWTRHILHSTSLLFHLSLVPTARFLDLGTGGGLPGIPLAILLPGSEFVLIDSVRKKTLAVRDIKERLCIDRIKVKCGRAEELGVQKEFRAQFEYVVTRGVATLPELVKWSTLFLKSPVSGVGARVHQNGKLFVQPPALIAMKGGDLEREVATAAKDKHVREILLVDLTIKGLEDRQLTHKKAVVVQFSVGN